KKGRPVGRLARRQLYSHASAAPRLAVDVEPAAVAIDDRARDRHAEAGAARLGGEEQLEDARPRLLVHAAAGVRDLDRDAALGTRLRPDRQRAAILHRIEPVHDEVQQRLPYLAP